MVDNQVNWPTGLISSRTSHVLGKNQTTGVDIHQAHDARFVTYTEGSKQRGHLTVVQDRWLQKGALPTPLLKLNKPQLFNPQTSFSLRNPPQW